MLIRYHDGRTSEAVLVSRTTNSIRVAMEGVEDVTEFREINGTWISESCESATIEFASAQPDPTSVVEVEDCICPPELASRLVAMLYDRTRTPELEKAATIASALVVSAGSSFAA